MGCDYYDQADEIHANDTYRLILDHVRPNRADIVFHIHLPIPVFSTVMSSFQSRFTNLSRSPGGREPPSAPFAAVHLSTLLTSTFSPHLINMLSFCQMPVVWIASGPFGRPGLESEGSVVCIRFASTMSVKIRSPMTTSSESVMLTFDFEGGGIELK